MGDTFSKLKNEVCDSLLQIFVPFHKHTKIFKIINQKQNHTIHIYDVRNTHQSSAKKLHRSRTKKQVENAILKYALIFQS